MRILKQVPKILFGSGMFEKLDEFISDFKLEDEHIVYLFDSVHKKTGLVNRLKLKKGDCCILIDTTDEPKTELIDSLREQIQAKNDRLPKIVVGIGGGSVMDIAKAVSVVLTNEGSSQNYQGWNLVKNPPIPKIGIPTISGTGSEATRTAVLTGPEKKMGINSEYSMFDGILLDPSLTKTVKHEQAFYTGMDCYIHCVESINGTFINNFVKIHVKNALEICRRIFLKEGNLNEQDREDLMIASYAGGLSVANSEVGVCHALSYGLSLELGFHHGIANCIVFNHLEEYYPKESKEFRKMLKANDIRLPVGVTKNLPPEKMDKMVSMALKMERPLENALGPNWKELFTEERIISLYNRM